MSVTKRLRPAAFFSAALKVERAYKHIAELESMLQAARDAGPYIPFIQPSDQADTVLVGIGFSEEALRTTRDAQLVVGDVVHNLKSALDHLVYIIMLAAGEKPTHMYFPIDIELNSFVGQGTFREIQRVAPDIADLILNEIKPYGTGNPFVKLNQLDRTDKHRLLLVAAVEATCHVYATSRDDDAEIPANAAGCLLIMTDPTRAPRPGSRADIHNKKQGYSSFDISFGPGQPFEKEPVVPTLHQLAQLVRGVIETLAAHCFGVEAWSLKVAAMAQNTVLLGGSVEPEAIINPGPPGSLAN